MTLRKDQILESCSATTVTSALELQQIFTIVTIRTHLEFRENWYKNTHFSCIDQDDVVATD